VPTYQYACTTCGAQLEVVQKFSDDPLTECPECAGRLRKVFSAVGVVFKGSGFYRNDSRSDKGAKANGTKQKTESAASESKSDSDSGAKTESKSSDSASSSGSTSTASNGSSSSTSSSGKSEKVA
jgi:putative FmdB family regulatory protein